MPPRKKPRSAAAVAATGGQNPAQYLTSFLQYLEVECGMSANTLSAYRSDLVQFFTWYATQRTVRVADVDLKLLTGYLQHLNERQLAPTTVSRHLVAIKMFFRYLVLEGILLQNVVDLLNSPKLWQYLPTVLSPGMVDKLLAAPQGEFDRYPRRDRALLALLYATGCRASEVSDLTLSDLHLDENFARCVGKGNKERIVSLNPLTVAAIQTYLEQERPELAQFRDADWLFMSRSGGGLSRISIWRLVKRYAARIGASQRVSPHTLRHSFATHLLAGGADIRAVQELLGHASISTTQIYTQVEHSRLKAVHRACHPRG